MGKKIDQAVKVREAKALADLIAQRQVTNYAEFARKNGVPGGKSMLKQHLDAARPISMDAALAYINGLNCDLRQLSPRLADAVSASSHLADKTPPTQLLSSAEQKLVNAYRAADERGHAALLWIAEQILAAPSRRAIETADFAPAPRAVNPDIPALKDK